MLVKNGNKILWHIQNMNICEDDSPYDMFLWSEKEPTNEEIKKAFCKDFDDPDDEEVEELINYIAEIWQLEFEEVKE